MALKMWLSLFKLVIRYSLKDLDLLGQDMSYVPLQEIGVLKNLRTLGLAAVKDFGQVRSWGYYVFSVGEIKVVHSVKTITPKWLFTIALKRGEGEVEVGLLGGPCLMNIGDVCFFLSFFSFF